MTMQLLGMSNFCITYTDVRHHLLYLRITQYSLSMTSSLGIWTLLVLS